MKKDWTYKKLGEVCNILNGYAFKSTKYVNEGIRVIRIANVQKGVIVDEMPAFYPSNTEQEIKKYMLHEGDILMSLTGNVGRVGILQKEMLPAALNQRVACLRFKEYNVSPRYIFHYLNSDLFESLCIASARGIAQLNMSTDWLKEQPIPVPPISIQESIVRELDAIHGILEKKQEQLRELDNLAQAIFYEMFGDPITNPKQWEVKKLIELVHKDCPVSYGIVQPGDGEEKGVPVVRPVDLKDSDYIGRENLKLTTQEISDSYSRTILRGDEILICVRGTTGLLGLVSSELKGCNVTRGIVPLFFADDIATKLFIFSALKTSAIQSIIADKTYGATLKQINIKDLRDIEFPLPPLSLQQSFAAKIEAIEAQKQAVQQSIREVEALLAERMDYYFS